MGNRRTKRGILIIEDNDLNREMLRVILENDYRVIEATDGKQGLEMLRQNFRDLSVVLLDVQMPEMDGYEFLRIYREDDMISSVPVIVATGSSDSEDEEKCLAFGAADFVTKPYKPNVILRRIEAVIRLHESIATLQAVEFDSLTGLYTKKAFRHHAENIVRDGDRYDMLMINIEDFSYLNERYGEARCSQLLQHIGKFLLINDRYSIIASRYTDDRFVMMRKHTDSNHEVEAAEFDRRLHKNAPIADFTVKYALYDDFPTDVSADVLFSRLALAAKTIKHQYNRQVAFYDPSMSERNDRLRKIEECMEEALREKQFRVYFQPKHDSVTGKLSGAEALVRWTHPEYGFLSPGDFIPLFEENGFITQLDLYVWQTVCENLRLWREAGLTPVPVSVNASRRDFVHIDSAETLLNPLLQNNIDKKYLHIEITESLGVSNEAVFKKVKVLHDLGFQIELDDFGSGQSSLGTIKDIPMDVIKLDVSFARALDKQKEIVQMIISLAHALGHKTVAEGIETDDQLETLRELGCDFIQGYYYSKPLPEAEFREYLRRANAAEAQCAV